MNLSLEKALEELRKSKNRKFELLVTKTSERYKKLSHGWFGKNIKPKLVKI